MESRVPWRGSQGHSSSDGTTGKLYFTKYQGPAQPPRFPEFMNPPRMRIQLPTFSGGPGCAFGDDELAGICKDHLSPATSERGAVSLWDRHQAGFGSSVPVRLLVIPLYAPQQMTTLPFAFSPSIQAFPASGLNLPAGSPSFRLCLALVLLSPLLVLIPVLPEQLISLEAPGGLTFLTCHPTFLVCPLYLLLQPSPRSLTFSRENQRLE